MFLRDQLLASGQMGPWHAELCTVASKPSGELENFLLLECSASTQCLGHFHANCMFFPQRKMLTELYLASFPFCGSWSLSSPVRHKDTKTSPPHSMSASQPKRCTGAALGRSCCKYSPGPLQNWLYQGHFETRFLNEIESVFLKISFPLHLSFFFSTLLSFKVFIYSCKGFGFGITKLSSFFSSTAVGAAAWWSCLGTCDQGCCIFSLIVLEQEE